MTLVDPFWHWIIFCCKDGTDCFVFLCSIACMLCDVFALPLGVIGRLCSVIVALPGHLLYYLPHLHTLLPNVRISSAASCE